MSIVKLSITGDGKVVKKEITAERIKAVWEWWFSLNEEERAKISAVEDGRQK